MKKIIRILCILTLSLSIVGCKDFLLLFVEVFYFHGIELDNYSSETVYAGGHYNQSFGTDLPQDSSMVNISLVEYQDDSNDRSSVIMVYSSRDERWIEAMPPDDTIRIFIIAKDVYEKKSWKEIASNYLILQRYDITAQEVLDLDKKLTYPPDERMKNIHMWPLYEAAGDE